MKNCEDILGKTVTVMIDRPLGSYHPEHETLRYALNYGYIKGIAAGDGECQDAYVMGVEEPAETVSGRVIAVLHRRDDVEDKWVVAPEGLSFDRGEILRATHFQERFFDIEIFCEGRTKGEEIKMEEFAIPGAGGIIVAERDGLPQVLLQERSKPDAPLETAGSGILEIPAGKIRAFENVFDALRREIAEETGLSITEIEGEAGASVYRSDRYKVVNFAPFACAQNTAGTYPVMVLVFICHATGNLLDASDEARNFRWVGIDALAEMLAREPQRFYPMHVDTLRKFVRSR